MLVAPLALRRGHIGKLGFSEAKTTSFGKQNKYWSRTLPKTNATLLKPSTDASRTQLYESDESRKKHARLESEKKVRRAL